MQVYTYLADDKEITGLAGQEFQLLAASADTVGSPMITIAVTESVFDCVKLYVSDLNLSQG